jgi:hypothetical protein
MMWLNRLVRQTTLQAAALAALAVLSSGSGIIHGAQAQVYLAGFEDVPVMTGLDVMEGAGIDFDAPSGRIVETYATGNLSTEAVLAFYTTTLQQLGWREIGTGAFEREGETLRLGFDESDGELTVHFRLSPGGPDAGSADPAQSN